MKIHPLRHSVSFHPSVYSFSFSVPLKRWKHRFWWFSNVWYHSKVTSHSHAFFSGVNWSTRGEQRVGEMASQANTWLEPPAKSSFLHTVVTSRCCEYSSENLILYYPSYVYFATSTGRVSSRWGFDNWYSNLCWVVNNIHITSTKQEWLNELW